MYIYIHISLEGLPTSNPHPPLNLVPSTYIHIYIYDIYIYIHMSDTVDTPACIE